MSVKWRLLVCLALAPGCGVFAPKGPTEVARGEYYSAGKPEYDRFFILLHEKQVQLLSAPQEPIAARRGLSLALGLTPDASDAALRERLEHELKELAAQGLRTRLETPQTSADLTAFATLYTSDATTSTPLRATLPQEATRLVRSRNGMLATKAELSKLRLMSITLEGSVEPTFRTEGPWKRDEVLRNLADSQKVITLMEGRAQEVADRASSLLALLTTAATTDASLGVPLPSPSKEEERPTLRRGSASRSSSASVRSAASNKPASGAVAKPPVKGEAEANAPKPVPGSAPAEIEP